MIRRLMLNGLNLKETTPIERKIKKLDDYIVVALFHHHFYLFPEVANQFGDSSLIRNYAEVIQHLRYMNVIYTVWIMQ